ncbi:hypothetical protein Tco_0913171 [Tanacetum coccineum]
MSESAKRYEENSNLIKEIRASTDTAIRNQEASIKTLEIQIGQMSKVLQERGFGSLPSSTETNLRDKVKSISTFIKADSNSIHRIGSNQYAIIITVKKRGTMDKNSRKLVELHILTMPYPERRKTQEVSLYLALLIMFCFDNGSLTVELADRTVKYPKGIAENVLVGIGKFTFPVDFIILDMPEDIKVPLILEDPFLFCSLENMDAYRDEGMGDVIFGEPFLREADIKAKRFVG